MGGIDRDDAFNEFFGTTGAERFYGFKSFKLSLYCFITQLAFLISQKFVYAPLRPLVLLATAYLAYTHMYKDSESVLKAAEIIYSTPATQLTSMQTHRERRASFLGQRPRQQS